MPISPHFSQCTHILLFPTPLFDFSEETKSDRIVEAKLLRATFYILSKQQDKAFADLEDVIENEKANPKMRANALIKRASLYIQRCQDPQKDPLLSFKDFERATEIDPNNADVYHHRGQVSYKQALKILHLGTTDSNPICS